MRYWFGKLKVSKTLGFAAHNVMRTQIKFRATGYNGRVSINPLYPTYKTLNPPPYQGGARGGSESTLRTRTNYDSLSESDNLNRAEPRR